MNFSVETSGMTNLVLIIFIVDGHMWQGCFIRNRDITHSLSIVYGHFQSRQNVDLGLFG